jgi:predicted RecA/RadA family phage recombinase
MSYTGQPIPSTEAQITRAKVSDGKSVKVTVPENTTIVAQQFYLLGGFFGVAVQSVVTEAGQTDEVTLTIEQAEYETDNIVPTEAFNQGDKIYWDDTAKKFTVTVGENRLVGRVTQPKDSNNVIWFILLPQYA